MNQPKQDRAESVADQRDQDEAKKSRPSRLPETDPALNNPDSTPGTGMLPEIGEDDTNVQPSS
jgi:hypothetical protein